MDALQLWDELPLTAIHKLCPFLTSKAHRHHPHLRQDTKEVERSSWAGVRASIHRNEWYLITLPCLQHVMIWLFVLLASSRIDATTNEQVLHKILPQKDADVWLENLWSINKSIDWTTDCLSSHLRNLSVTFTFWRCALGQTDTASALGRCNSLSAVKVK